jgi:hypothetical protein
MIRGRHPSGRLDTIPTIADGLQTFDHREAAIQTGPAAYYNDPPKQLHPQLCMCSCAPLIERDPDMLGGIRCVKCGRPRRA